MKNCKYVVKKKKVPKYITDNEEISPDEENSDKWNTNKESSDAETLMKKIK